MADLDWIDQLKVVELRKRLKELGENTTGKKTVLTERLKQRMSQETKMNEEQIQPTEEEEKAVELMENKPEEDQGGLDALLGDGKDDLEFDFDTEKPHRKKQKVEQAAKEEEKKMEVDDEGQVSKPEDNQPSKDPVQEETPPESTSPPVSLKLDDLEAFEVKEEDQTRALHIERFVRPFTEKAARGWLAEFGTVEEMWMPNIKNQCYVIFATKEIAYKAYKGTYNVVWPRHGNKLISKFVSEEDAKKAIEEGKAHSNFARASGSASLQKTRPSQSAVAPAPPTAPSQAPRPASKPALSLEDLFFKTQAKPHIYYLPLTDEQVAAKKQAVLEKEAPSIEQPTSINRE